jgi:hypothetical protein
MRRRIILLAVGLALAGCASPPADDPADVSLHLQQRLDAAFNPGLGGIDRPAAAPVRFALPNGWGGLMGRCMNDSGFTAFDYDRFYGFTNAGEQASHTGAEGLAWYRCTQQYPEFDTVFVKFSDADLDTLYDYYAEVLVPCLGALGAPVTEMPSRTDFADGGAGQPGWWNPYLSVDSPGSTANVDLLFAKCDAYPAAVRP